MFGKSNAYKTIYLFLVLLKYREIIMVKTVTRYKKLYLFSLKFLKAGTNFVLLCQSRNTVGQFKRAYLHRQIKVLHFLIPTRI